MEVVANGKEIGLKRELKTILSDLVEARYRAWTEEGGGQGMVIVDDFFTVSSAQAGIDL